MKALFLLSPRFPEAWTQSMRLQLLEMAWETAKRENPEITEQLRGLPVNPSDFEIKSIVIPPGQGLDIVDAAGAVMVAWMDQMAAVASEPGFRPLFWAGTASDPPNFHFELVVLVLVFGTA